MRRRGGRSTVEPLPQGVGRRRTPHTTTQPMKDQIPPFWSEKVYGVARGAWEPRRALRGGNCSPAHIIEIEQRLRAKARAAAPPTTSSRDKFARDLVFRLLAARDSGGAPNYGKTAIKGVMEPFEHVGTITAENFVKVLRRKLGVSLEMEEAIAIFKLYGHNEEGQLPYEVFCARLFGGEAKTLAKQGYRDGPYIWDRPSGMEGDSSVIRWDWDGMVRYPQCKNAVLPPSNWPLIAQPSCKLSKEKPDKYLKIEHIFGYSVQKSPNLYYNKNGDVVYFAAGAGVVYDDDGGGDDSKANRQKFFLRHDDDIECLAMHRDRDTVATGQFGVEPTVWIWSSSTRGVPQDNGNPIKDDSGNPLSSPICLTLPPEGRKSGEKGERSVIACGFSADGEYLATVSTDEGHTVRVWNWKRQRPLEGMMTNAYKGEPPAVFGVIWNPYAGTYEPARSSDPRYPDATATEGSDGPVDFLTFGINHMAFWKLGNGELEKTLTSFGECQIQDVLHACFLPSGHILTGGPNGSITIYDPTNPKGPAAFQEIKGAHEDRSGDYDPRSEDAAHMVIVVKDDAGYSPDADSSWEVTVLSGGPGGVIKEWKWRPKDVSNSRTNRDFELVPSRQWDLNNVGSDRCPEIVALDIDPFDPNKFVAGSAGSDIWEVDDSPRVMVQGQSDCVYGLAAYPCNNVWGNPAYASIYASGCEDGRLYIWDSRRRECLHALPITRFDDHKPEEQDPELRAKDAGFPRNQLLKVRAVEWSSNGDQLVLTTCGVVDAPDSTDVGGVIQVYAVDEQWFMDDDNIPDYNQNTFLLDYRVWEAKDCNAVIDDCKFSPDGRFIAAGSHDSNIYLYEVLPQYVENPSREAKPQAKTSALIVAQELRQRLKKIEQALNSAVALDDGGEIARDTYTDKDLKALLRISANADLHEAAGRLIAQLGEKFFGKYCEKRGYCDGHSTYVSHIEWTRDSKVLQSTSGDSELLYWDVKCPRRGTGRANHGGLMIPQLRAERASELGCAVRDMQWAGWSCLQGFPVMGIWQDGQCGNDINSCHRSPDGRLLVTSDDEGYVRVFNYPCVIKEAPHHALKGHAAFTENVRFLEDGNYADARLPNARVVSAGGGDRCLIQWRLRPVPGCGDKQAKLRRELDHVQSVHTLQQTVEDNELLLQQKEKQLHKLKMKLALTGGAGVKGRAVGRSVSTDSRATQSKDDGLGLDLHRLKAEFSRMAKRDGAGRGKIQLPSFQLLMNRLGLKATASSDAKNQHITRRLFKAFDRSGDGKLSLDELEGGLLLLCSGRGDEKADIMFTMIDTDGDGTISQTELNVFISGIFVLTEDTINNLFVTVEKLLPHPIGEDRDGSTRSSVQQRQSDFRQRIHNTLRQVLERHRDSLIERAMATADTDNDGEISEKEWFEFCSDEPQLLDWLDKLGTFWTAIIQGKKIGDEDGHQTLSSSAMQGYLHTKLSALTLPTLVGAIKSTHPRLDEDGCIALFASLNLNNDKLAKAMFSIFDPDQLPGDQYPTVDSRQILIGLSTICAAGRDFDPLSRLSFAFDLFDADQSGELDDKELHEFFESFRRPVLAGVHDTMEPFFQTCGYEAELRDDIDTAAKAVFDNFVDAIITSVFMNADVNHNREVSKDEFLIWAGRHQESLIWLNSLATYVLESLAKSMSLHDFEA